jgi:hypothetical protein
MVNVKAECGILLRIVGKILHLVSEGDDVASQGTCLRLMGVIDTIQRTADANSIQVAFSMMEQDAQQALVAAMQ